MKKKTTKAVKSRKQAKPAKRRATTRERALAEASDLEHLAKEFTHSRRNRTAGEQAREDAIDQAERGAGEDWMMDALLATRIVARARPTFTTDEVWAVLGRDPSIEGRAMGAVLRHAAGAGLCRRTDTTRKSLRVICHRRDLRVWQSLIAMPSRPRASRKGRKP